MGLTDITFNALKSSDKNLVSNVQAAVKNAEFSFNSATLQFISGGSPIQIAGNNFDNSELVQILKLGGENIQSFNFTVKKEDSGPNFPITISRQPDHEKITLKGNGVGHEFNLIYLELANSFRKHLKAIDSVEVATNLPQIIEKHYKVRENELNRLTSISERLISEQEEFRNRLEEQYQDKKEKLENLMDSEKEKLKNERDEFEKSKSEFDNRASKHVRRDLRKALKTIFEERSQAFELSKGTVGLRKPVQYFTILLLIFLGSLFLISSLQTFGLISSGKNSDWSFHIKQIALTLSFGATAIFYIKWNNKWFERHSNEEFLLKRQEIDVDRASWAVELAIEWIEQHQNQIPDILLEKLTKNLFEYDEKHDEELHPADQLASALLGSSSSVDLSLPNNSSLKIDRKGIKRLSEKN